MTDVFGIPLQDLRTYPWWPEGAMARINAGFAGHDREIVVVIDPYDWKNPLPDLVVEALRALLPESWKVDNRASRVELHPSGRRYAGFNADDIEAVRRALPQMGLTLGAVEVANIVGIPTKEEAS